MQSRSYTPSFCSGSNSLFDWDFAVNVEKYPNNSGSTSDAACGNMVKMKSRTVFAWPWPNASASTGAPTPTATVSKTRAWSQSTHWVTAKSGTIHAVADVDAEPSAAANTAACADGSRVRFILPPCVPTTEAMDAAAAPKLASNAEFARNLGWFLAHVANTPSNNSIPALTASTKTRSRPRRVRMASTKANVSATPPARNAATRAVFFTKLRCVLAIRAQSRHRHQSRTPSTKLDSTSAPRIVNADIFNTNVAMPDADSVHASRTSRTDSASPSSTSMMNARIAAVFRTLVRRRTSNATDSAIVNPMRSPDSSGDGILIV